MPIEILNAFFYNSVMGVKKLFVSAGKLRAGWRMLIFLLISFPPLYFLTLVLWTQLLLLYIIIFGILLGISFLFAALVDKRPIGTIGYMFHSRWLKEYIQGILIGLVLVSCLFLFEWLSGFIAVRINRLSWSLFANIFLFSMMTTVFQSAFEELFFRGYLFQTLIEGTNVFTAVIILSGLFGIGHLLNPHADWLTGLNLTVLGVMLALGYVRTRSLWLSSGLHFSWNFFMRNIYSLPVSGTQSGQDLFTVESVGPNWLTGGNYGPEGGIPGLMVMIAACVFIYYGKGIGENPQLSTRE